MKYFTIIVIGLLLLVGCEEPPTSPHCSRGVIITVEYGIDSAPAIISFGCVTSDYTVPGHQGEKY